MAMGNNPVNYIDPNGGFSSRREARQYRRANDISGNISKTAAGEFTINSGNTSFYHGEAINYGSFDASSNMLGGVTVTGDYTPNFFISHPRGDRGYYGTSSLSNLGIRFKEWELTTLDGHNNGNETPRALQVVAGINPLISVPNAVKILVEGEDIYNQSANTAIDKGFAIIDIVSPLSPGKNLLKKFGAENTGKVIDMGLNVGSGVNNSGVIDPIK